MTSHTIRCTQTSLGPGAELLPQATEIDAEKGLKISAKIVGKWSQNGVQNQ